MKKRLLSAITAFAVTASGGLLSFPAGTFGMTAKADDKITGETSDGFTYEIDGEEVIITGWTGDKETVTSLTVPDEIDGQTVTRLGQRSLCDMPLLTSIDLPSGLTYMGIWALSDNKSLKEITLPKTMGENGIGAGSYYGVGARTSFSGTPLETIILEDGMEAVPCYLCDGIHTITKVVIPDSVTSIGYRAFANSDGLTELDIPSSVTTIEWCAFTDSCGFTEIVLPEGIETIEKNAFDGCQSLTTMKFPSTLKTIGMEALMDCDSLTSVEFNEGLEKIGLYLFSGSDNLKEVTIPSTVTSASSMFQKSYVETVTFADGMEKLPDGICGYTEYLTQLNIPDSVTDLGSGLFYLASGIKEFVIPAQITAGKGAFSRSSLETVSFEPGLTEIPERLFEDAAALKNLTWPEGVTFIGNSAFSGCKSLESIDIPDTVKKIENGAFKYCSSATYVHIPENGCELESGIFCYANALKSVTIPAGLTFNKGEYLFQYCDGLESVTVAEGNTYIPSNTFENCISLVDVKLPSTLEEIQYRAFQECTSLRSIDIPDSVKSVNRESFAYCYSLESVHLPASIEWLGSYVFEYDYSLKGIVLPKNIAKTDGSCFYRSGLTEVWFEDGIEIIPDNMCSNTDSLIVAHIPGSVKEIGNQAFYGCPNLKTLDMPFEPGELVPNVNYFYMTFYGCDSLTDERVTVSNASATFINKIESTPGEGGIVNYTVYYDTNPIFKDIFQSGYINIYTKDGNPIANRSLPVGLRPSETEAYSYSLRFRFDATEQDGVFRFSTEPAAGADTTVSASIVADYTNGYREFSQNILVDNEATSKNAVTIFTPESAPVKDGAAQIDLYGYAPVNSDVSILADGEEVLTLTPNKYTGRFSGTINVDVNDGQAVEIQAKSGEQASQKKTVYCRSSAVNVEKAVLFHNNTHSEYGLDITTVFTEGTRPYIAFNPNKPVGFEVTLSENDCVAVYVSSTVNGQESDIPLTFDETTGTWKGEGYFSPRVPGTLNINAIRESASNMVEKKSNGKLYIEGHEFLETEDGENVPDISDELIAEAKTEVSGDDDTIIATFDYSELLEEPAGIIHIETREKTIELNGSMVTPEDVIADPESFGFVKSPMTYKDEKGEIHQYLVKIVTDGDEMLDIMNSIPDPDAQGAGGSGADPYSKVKDGTLMNRLLNGFASLGGSSGTVNKCTSGTIAIDLPASMLSGEQRDDLAYDFVVTETTETEKALLEQVMKAKDAKMTKILGKECTKYSSGLNKVNKRLTVIEIGSHCAGMVSEIRDIINSDDPRVQKHEDALLAVSVGTCMSKATLTLAGGAAIGATITSAAAVIAGGAAILPEVLAVGAVIAGVWLVGKAIDGVSSWLKGVIIGDAKVSNDGKMNYLIDPSGIAYEFLPSNPIEGVTAEIYYKDEDGNEVLWNAIDFDQINPQITDSAGWFAWDVPEGEWKVKLSAEGYESTESEWLPVLPVQTDVNLNMNSSLPAEIKTAEYNSKNAVITFTRHLKDETVTADSLYLTDSEGNLIPAAIKAIKEEGNSTDCSITYVLTPTEATDLEGAFVNITPDAVTYSGVASGAASRSLTKGEEYELPEDDYMLGDVNGDRMIDSTDASEILQEYAHTQTGGTATFIGSLKLAADVNSDDRVDSSDASYVLSYYAFIMSGGKGTMPEFMAAQ